MRLLRSDSSDVARVLASRDCILVRRRLYDFPTALLGNAIILVLLAGARVAIATLPVLRIGLSLLLLWNLMLAVRTKLGKTNWVVAVSGKVFLLKLFVPRGPGGVATADLNVMEMHQEEIASLSFLTTDLMWPGTSPSVIQWLVVEPSSTSREAFEDCARPLFPSSWGCDPHREWFAGWKDMKVFVRWELFQPDLPHFWTLIRLQKPNYSIAEGQRSSLDLRTFWSKPEEEQSELLRSAKRLGFGPTCILILKRYRHMSAAESLRYLAKIEIDDVIGD